MRKLLLTLVATGLMLAGYSQNGNNICVFNSIYNYNNGGGIDELLRGMKCSDEAILNESTKGDTKTWNYRGQLYTLAFLDTNITNKYTVNHAYDVMVILNAAKNAEVLTPGFLSAYDISDAIARELFFMRSSLPVSLDKDKVQLRFRQAVKAAIGLEAVEAFNKLAEIKNPKFKEWDDVFRLLHPLANNIFNLGVEQYQTGNFDLAYKYFYSIKDIDTVFRLRNEKSNIDLRTAIKNAATCAENSGNFNDAIDCYKYLVEIGPAIDLPSINKAAACAKNATKNDEAAKCFKDIQQMLPTKDLSSEINAAVSCIKSASSLDGAINCCKVIEQEGSLAPIYRNYIVDLKKQGKAQQALLVLDEALAKFPTDANLLVEKINVYLEKAQYTEALDYVNKLLVIDPKNDGALFIKGLAFEKIGNEDSIITYYTLANEANPNNLKPLNNLGALYVNKANALTDQMNKLGNTSADTKKYEELKAQQKALYLKAKPYLEKAHNLDATDAQINRTLKQIQMLTGQ